MDREANEFAMHLLMPTNLVHNWMKKYGSVDLVDDRLLIELSKSFKVPIIVATIRLSDLGYFKH